MQVQCGRYFTYVNVLVSIHFLKAEEQLKKKKNLKRKALMVKKVAKQLAAQRIKKRLVNQSSFSSSHLTSISGFPQSSEENSVKYI